MKDVQRQAWQITLNHPEDKGWTHDKIRDTLANHFKKTKYFCMADEIGKEGTPHTHIYVYFESRVRFSTVKKKFPEAHIEAAIANIEANIAYIKKSGKWAESDKAETSIEGTFEEWGERPKTMKVFMKKWMEEKVLTLSPLKNMAIFQLTICRSL